MRRTLLSSAVLVLGAIAAAITVLAQTGTAPALPSQEGGRARFIHASPDGPAVDVMLDGSEVFTDTAFGEITEYTDVMTGTHTVTIEPTGGGDTLLTRTLVMTDTDHTLAAAGTLTTTDAIDFELLRLIDDNSAPAPGMIRGRLVHLSPGGPAVDVAIKDGDVLFGNIGYKGIGDYVEIAGGTYELEIRLAGTGITLGSAMLTVRPNNVYTVFAIGRPLSIQFVQTLDRSHGSTVLLPLVTRRG